MASPSLSLGRALRTFSSSPRTLAGGASLQRSPPTEATGDLRGRHLRPRVRERAQMAGTVARFSNSIISRSSGRSAAFHSGIWTDGRRQGLAGRGPVRGHSSSKRRTSLIDGVLNSNGGRRGSLEGGGRRQFRGGEAPRLLGICRCMSSDTPSMLVFNRAAKMLHRDRAALRADLEDFHYVHDHVARVLVDRIEDITRPFPAALDLGCRSGILRRLICQQRGLGGEGGVGGITSLVEVDFSKEMLLRSASEWAKAAPSSATSVETLSVQADEEFLPFRPESFDLVLSNLSLQWVNDLPQALKQVQESLKPNGCFIASMFGGNNLTELRSCLLLAEQEREGGMSAHTSPAAYISDCGSLLSGAGFNLPTVDQDTFTVHYPSAFVLMEHLQAMGENNAALGGRPYVNRETFLAAAAVYQDLYGEEDGSVPATFQVVYMIGWAPHESQQQPKRPGSGATAPSIGSSVSHHKAGDTFAPAPAPAPAGGAVSPTAPATSPVAPTEPST